MQTKRCRPKSSSTSKRQDLTITQSQTYCQNSALDLTQKSQAHHFREKQFRSFTHATPPKQYRINEQDVYNYVRNSIYETFKQKNSRNYELVRELTSETAPSKVKQIDRLCRKYSILKKQQQQKSFEDGSVNIEEIACRYVKSRSIEKQKEENRRRLKRDVAKFYLSGTNKNYCQSEVFFSFEGDELKKMEKKALLNEKRKGKRESASLCLTPRHPYLEIYENAQTEALMDLSKNKSLEMSSDYPSFPEQEDWEKNRQNIQNIVSMVVSCKIDAQSAKMRTVRYPRSKNSAQFFLT